jgi:hypothetical protein
MTQISRPFQIGLLAVALFAVVWFLALRGHSSPGTSSGSPAPAVAAGPPAAQSAAGGGTPASTATTYHGSAPGVAGLTHAIERARGAVTQSQQNAKQLQQKSAQASEEAPAQSSSSAKGSTSASHAASASTTHGPAASHGSTTAAKATPKTAAASGAHGSETSSQVSSGPPQLQATVEGELKHGKVVAVLFWNPKGFVDTTVRRELQAAGRKLHGKLAVHVALAGQVGSFGSFTHTVQVYSTPTILLINTTGKTAGLTGLTDAFSIEQAVTEVKHAK